MDGGDGMTGEEMYGKLTDSEYTELLAMLEV